MYLYPTTSDTVLKLILDVLAWVQVSDWAMVLCAISKRYCQRVKCLYSDILTVSRVFYAFAHDMCVLLAMYKLSSRKFILFLDNRSVLSVIACISLAVTVYSRLFETVIFFRSLIRCGRRTHIEYNMRSHPPSVHLGSDACLSLCMLSFRYEGSSIP